MNQALLRPLFDHEPPSEIHFASWPIESITGIKDATVVPSDVQSTWADSQMAHNALASPQGICSTTPPHEYQNL